MSSEKEDSSSQVVRETLSSRLGFLLLAAGCAIGLGNVWRFPYICGSYGGAIFLVFYLVFLLFLGLPVMVAELAVGRAGREDLIGCLRKLKNPQTKVPWGGIGCIQFSGLLVLLMFYSVITGWLISYTWDYASGRFSSVASADIPTVFGGLLESPGRLVVFDGIAILITLAVCATGLKSGVERITKIMMLCLFIIMLGLAGYAVCLPNSSKGLSFFLFPNLENVRQVGIFNTMHAALMQAFFTLSLGIGSIAVCGSYSSRDKSLTQEAFIIIGLDTFVAVCAGLIIFPCCAIFNVSPNQGPGLIFLTLPQIFCDMPYGTIMGLAFFVFMSVAALTTLIAVSEGVIAFCIDQLKMKRWVASCMVAVVVFVLSLPCAFGFNIWKGFKPFGGDSSVLDLEDFIVSDNLLPLGALCFCLFCTRNFGWGMNKFLEEVNAGTGMKFPKFLCSYMRWGLPLVLFAIWVYGIIGRFC
ncbi:MAG: sodium-dependent transporter [Victivallales bacterium]|nr:sodium-dependent transporter [Victivallales bacterium]